MSEDQLNQLVYSKEVIEFVTLANEYCKFVENAGSLKTRDFLSKIQKILPLVYLKTSMLPNFESTEEVVLEKFVSEVDYSYLQQRMMNMLGEHDDYQEVFDRDMQFSEVPLTASISENLADIYQDLKDFALCYRTGDEFVMQEALWECIDNFKNYWGQKLVNAMRAIHALVYSSIDFETEVTIQNDEESLEDTKPDWLNNLFNDPLES
ncbi:DUF5063 domain-containing protein [Mangrovibacterium marinum]|uniref:Uncharacterized protein DUF5063 n=1 Tax=Mangrovibacterium marinum TaxID=1639118 RepID=A0A2T5BZP4_9BACT|nr:DUF5063 domain-containing protein [Mangrovibacterium marinum]PTN07770.1 uncharacterized protein DUF5063 [Mangrovibacterium marinum]